MAGDRAHFPHDGEAAKAIADMNNAAQRVLGWLQTMSDDEVSRAYDGARRTLIALVNEQARRHERTIEGAPADGQ